MRTVCCSGCLSCHTCPPAMHTPCHAHPLPHIPHATHAPATHAPHHACPLAMHAPCHAQPLPCMPPAMHATLPCTSPHHACLLPCMPPPATHASLLCTPPATHTPLPCMPPATHTPTTHTPLPCMPPPLWTEFLTHACENITFPQLLLRTIKSVQPTCMIVDILPVFLAVQPDHHQGNPHLLLECTQLKWNSKTLRHKFQLNSKNFSSKCLKIFVPVHLNYYAISSDHWICQCQNKISRDGSWINGISQP